MADPTALSFLSRARGLDEQDPLAGFRSRFEIEDDGLIYLDGNSLGRMPKRARELLIEGADQWSKRLIRAWSESWMDAPSRIGGKIGRLIGAKPSEVMLADATSVNLFKLAVAAFRARPGRKRIVTDELNFPSDQYVLQGVSELLDVELVTAPSRDGLTTEPGDLAGALDESTALLALTHTGFKTGFVHDMAALTRAAHEKGAFALWDLSHSVGSVPVDLNGAGADLAIGCSYKYLNGGPGAPAFVYVREDLQAELRQPIWGWLGHESPFAFQNDYRPAEGLRRFSTGSPPVLSMLPLEAGVDLLLEAGMDRVREKSVQMTEFLIEMWEALLKPLGMDLASPRDPSKRGSHVSLSHPEGLAVDLALIREHDVVPDFRAPDSIRFGVAPLYNTFSEIAEALLKLKEVLETRSFEKYRDEQVVVT